MTELLLGIDGGGSKTTAVLAERVDEAAWKERGRGIGGASNVVTVGPAAALAELEVAVQAAFEQAGVPNQPVASACLGLAGSGREPVRQAVLDWAEARNLAHHITLVPDASLLLAWTSPKALAVALIAGTGSLAWARDPEGRTARAGGWGPIMGDEGSGYWVAQAALQAVAQAADQRRPPTALTALLLDACCPQRPIAELPAAVAGLDRTALASLAPHVLAAADAQDWAAEQIVGQAAEHLAEMVAAALRQLDAEQLPVELAVGGGLISASSRLQRELKRMLGELNVQVASLQVVEDPVLGAVQLAAGFVARDLS